MSTIKHHSSGKSLTAYSMSYFPPNDAIISKTMSNFHTLNCVDKTIFIWSPKDLPKTKRKEKKEWWKAGNIWHRGNSSFSSLVKKKKKSFFIVWFFHDISRGLYHDWCHIRTTHYTIYIFQSFYLHRTFEGFHQNICVHNNICIEDSCDIEYWVAWCLSYFPHAVKRSELSVCLRVIDLINPNIIRIFRKVNLTINTSGNKNDTYITAAVAKIYFLCLSVCGFVINKLISIRNQIKILFALRYLYIDVDRQ